MFSRTFCSFCFTGRLPWSLSIMLVIWCELLRLFRISTISVSKPLQGCPGRVKKFYWLLVFSTWKFWSVGIDITLVDLVYRLWVSLKYFSTRSSEGLFVLNSTSSFSTSTLSFLKEFVHSSQFSLSLQTACSWDAVIFGSFKAERNLLPFRFFGLVGSE